MRELRAVALSEDGSHLVLVDGNGGPEAERFRVPVDERLRATLRGARRAAGETRPESALSPREIQARLRAGETAAEVARVAGIQVERVERYEGPVLAERARVVTEARSALLPKDSGGVPGRPLGEVVDARLVAVQDDPEAAQWDAWRQLDGIWLVQLTSESRCARWTWDPVVRRVRPHDDAARALVTQDPVETAVAPQVPAQAPAPVAVRSSGPALTLVSEPPAPAPARPVTAQPAAVQPVTSQPVTSQPVTVQPAAVQPAAVPPAAAPSAPVQTPIDRPAGKPAAPAARQRTPAQERPGSTERRGSVSAVRAGAQSGPARPSAPVRPAGSGRTVPAAPAASAGSAAEAVPRTPQVPAEADRTDSQQAVGGEVPSKPAAKSPERSAGGRRGRKAVPAWDDIVFGARRP